MPSVVRERMQKLMDEQKAEAPLPTSRAVMDFGEPDVEPAEVQEPGQSAEEMPLPAEAATDAPESDDEPDDLPVESNVQEAEERDVEPQETPEEVPLPEESPSDSPQLANEEVEQSVGDEPEMQVPDSEEHQPGAADWEELVTEFQDTDIEDEQPDPYAAATADMEWRMALQGREQLLT